MADSAAKQCSDRTLSGALKAGDRARAARGRARTRMWAAVEALMDRAKAQGTMRAGRHAGGPAGALARRRARARARTGSRTPAEWRRYAALALGALRA